MRLPQQPLKKGRVEIIPMIDAIFFLLVYFIMTSLSLVQMDAHGVQLPASRTAGTKPAEKMVVTLTQAGELFVDSDTVSEAEMVRKVRDGVNANPEVAVVLNIDREAEVARFLRIFDLVKQADPGNVQIATAPPDPPGAPRKPRKDND